MSTVLSSRIQLLGKIVMIVSTTEKIAVQIAPGPVKDPSSARQQHGPVAVAKATIEMATSIIEVF